MSDIEARLQEAGITLPVPAAPVANYVGYTVTDTLVVISGQLAVKDGKVFYEGKLGRELDVAEGQQAARLCTVNLLAQLKQALAGDWNRLERCLRLGIFVNSTDDFIQQPQVANGASDLVVDILGDQGKHARAAVSCNSLPLESAVEVEGLFLLR